MILPFLLARFSCILRIDIEVGNAKSKNDHWLTSRLIINYFNLFGAEDEIKRQKAVLNALPQWIIHLPIHQRFQPVNY